MYEPALNYRRTPEEKINQILSWKRSDKAFFAAGACHILAFTFTYLHPTRNLKLVFIKPKGGFNGNHMYVLDNKWAFDFNGWTTEKELLKTTENAYRKVYATWDYDRIIINDDLETFCKNNNHRSPAHFAYLPWERTYNYIKQFNKEPPKN